MRPPSTVEWAVAVQLLAAFVIAAYLAAALAAILRSASLTQARLIAAEGIIAGLGFMTAATLLRTLTVRTWSQIATLAVILSLRLAVKQLVKLERTQLRARKRPARAATMGVAIAAIAPGAAGAQMAGDSRPAYHTLRYEEDWSPLRDSSRRTGWLDRLKYLPLDREGHTWLSLGGETRLRYEQYRNPLFGSDPPDASGYLLQRYAAHGDLRVDGRLRAFVQLQAALESGRAGGPRAFDENGLDLHQAFGELAVGRDGGLILRAGRQELDFGSSRLVSAREMVNVRQTFDGARVLLHADGSRASAWVLRPVLVERGIFDDSADSVRILWGASWIRLNSLLPGGTLAVYYIGLDRNGARFDQGTADELRHTVGLRLSGRTGPWDYSFEANAQFGRFGTGRIRAWDVGADNGVMPGGVPLRPRVGLRVDITSGDGDPADPDLGTFNPLFPNTAYSGLAGLVGPANSIDLQPSLRLFPTRSLSVVGGVTFFWRANTRDGLYGIAVNPQRPGGPSRARSVGRQVALEVDWSPTPQLTYQATFTHFTSGAYLRETPPGDDVRYLLTWVSWRF